MMVGLSDKSVSSPALRELHLILERHDKDVCQVCRGDGSNGARSVCPKCKGSGCRLLRLL